MIAGIRTGSTAVHVIMKLLIQLVFLAALAAILSSTAQAAVTFTVMPSTVSNTYNGTITLFITNIPAGDTVVVQKFLDANSNGVVDGNEWLVQQFNLTDGQATVFSGVTNYNVPGDFYAPTGAISTLLNFHFQQGSQSGDIAQDFVGKYLFKLSSPAGHFAPLTNAFTVTNFPFAQSIGGIVRSNGVAISNAAVILFTSSSSGDLNPVAGTIADNLGNYSIKAPVGTYLLAAFKTNCLDNLAVAPTVTLVASANITTNLNLTNATQFISGKVADTNTPSITLPGVLVAAMSTNSFIGIAFTDTNGNYTVGTRPNVWKLDGDSASITVHGYIRLQNKPKTNTTSGSLTGVNQLFPKATAMFYGTVRDSLNNPLSGVHIFSQDANSVLEDDVSTDQNGNYYADTLAGTWSVQVDNNNPLYTNYVFSQAPQVSFSAGQAVQANFSAIIGTHQITGSVKSSTNGIISGVAVTAMATINGTNYQTPNADTDGSGNYTLNVPNGNWSVSVSCNGDNDSLDGILGNGNYACPNSQNVNISGNNATNNIVVQLCGGISITTTSPLPVGEVGAFYFQTLQASSCSGSYSWSQTGGTLPSGVGLDTGGNLSGTPGNSGTFSFTAQVNDGSNTTNKLFSLSISNALSVTTTTLPNGTNGSAYSQQLLAGGGVTPYVWSLAPGSLSLPANLTLSGGGLLSGPAAVGGTYNFTVRVTDGLGNVADQPLSLLLNSTNSPPPLAVTTVNGQIIVLWPASAGTNFTLQTTTNLASGPWVTASNGVPQVSFIFTNTSPAVFFRLH